MLELPSSAGPMPAATDALVRRVLARYSSQFRPLAWQALGSAGGFSGATIVQVETPGGTFALRGWPSGSLPAARVAGLHRLTHHVARQGVTQVPLPATALDGASVAVDAGRMWQLETWRPGRADYWDDPRPPRRDAAVECLARWHRAAAGYLPQADDGRWFASVARGMPPGVAERIALLEHWNRARRDDLRLRVARTEAGGLRALALRILDGFERGAERVRRELQEATALRCPLQPCLRDVWHDHVLFMGDDVTGLIDASACRTESVAADLARLLGSLLGDDAAGWQAALERYERQRPLSLSERRLVGVYDRSAVLLSGMTWLEWLWLEGRRPEPLARVEERLERLAARLERLVERPG